jgi:DUF4097 and DUF4098 domain-containing protein YvlB
VIGVAVKDKLELERLLSILEGEISEETYREMKNNYKSRITSLQNKIMDMEQPSEQFKEGIEELKKTAEDMAAQMTENVNDLLKSTMKLLKEQLKTAGLENSSKKITKSEVLRFPLEDPYNPLMIKCRMEKGKIIVSPSNNNEISCTVVKSVKGMMGEEQAEKKLDRIEVASSTYMHDNVRVLKIMPSGPPSASVDITLEVPQTMPTSYDLATERGSIVLKHVAFDTCELEAENGNIEMRDCTGNSTTMSTETGSITVEGTDIVECELDTENGNIKIVDALGKTLEAKTEKGNITAYVAYETADLDTELGSIKFKPLAHSKQKSTLQSELGSIKILVPEEEDPWSIKAYVERGTIKNTTALKVKDENEFVIIYSNGQNADGIVVSASTELGSIRVCGPSEAC